MTDQELSKKRTREEAAYSSLAPGEDVTVTIGLYALPAPWYQPRASRSPMVRMDPGVQGPRLNSQVFDEQTLLAAMPGHVRRRPLSLLDHRLHHVGERINPCSATPRRGPVLRSATTATSWSNTAELAGRARARSGPDRHEGRAFATTDSDIPRVSRTVPPTPRSSRSALDLLSQSCVAFCLTSWRENALYAARDLHGVRPLSLGRLIAAGWSRLRPPPSTSSAPVRARHRAR